MNIVCHFFVLGNRTTDKLVKIVKVMCTVLTVHTHGGAFRLNTCVKFSCFTKKKSLGLEPDCPLNDRKMCYLVLNFNLDPPNAFPSVS